MLMMLSTNSATTGSSRRNRLCRVVPNTRSTRETTHTTMNAKVYRAQIRRLAR